MAVTLAPPGGFASSLDRRQEQRHEHADNRNHDQKFNQRKTAPAARSTAPHSHCLSLKKGSNNWNPAASQTPENLGGTKVTVCAFFGWLSNANSRRAVSNVPERGPEAPHQRHGLLSAERCAAESE